MTDTELRTPAPPTAAQSAALLTAHDVLWEALATWDMTPNGDTAYLLLKAYESLVTTDPALALTREALADGIALSRAREVADEGFILMDIEPKRVDIQIRPKYPDYKRTGRGPTLPQAVAAALDER